MQGKHAPVINVEKGDTSLLIVDLISPTIKGIIIITMGDPIIITITIIIEETGIALLATNLDILQKIVPSEINNNPQTKLEAAITIAISG